MPPSRRATHSSAGCWPPDRSQPADPGRCPSLYRTPFHLPILRLIGPYTGQDALPFGNPMSMVWIRRLILTGALGALSTMPAEAQIYAWRDAHGTLVLSDRPLDPSAVTYEVRDTREVRSTRQAAPFDAAIDRHIAEHAGRHNLRPDLVRAVIQVESAFNPNAVSPKGAMGLMQLMPATAAAYGVANPWDPDQNIRGGVAYLRHLLDRYEGDEELALAAYNAGPGAVDRHDRHVPPYRETRQYVRRVRSVTPAAASRTPTIYKRVVEVNGRLVPHYSNAKPESGAYEVVSARP